MLDFKYVDVACIKDGLLGVFDGWELDGQLFPNEEDHPQEFDRRYKTYCGDDKPNKIFISSQNVAMVQHRIPVAGGFSVHVKFVPNPKPCNVIARLPNGHYSLRNWGRALNCSFSMIYPERVRVRELTVGEREYTGVAAQVRRSPILGQCAKRGMKDYVEFRAGNGLDPKKMGYSFQMCGVATATTKKLEVPLGCGNSVVRLVSSGDFYNSVDFEFAILEPGESMISACTP
ncbi:PREDICTED: corticotropin-releasing factor-binding protein-like [Priapulus caudatus]|uniref:Corticotropin-releasing factor-binding protein-like n=1 Tax=Priapulus caudatus TaxID=37621 RepID=A0ABM1DT12_PRICU|nr:PREDICTED: corticotropin-releasing factor-binding protein-like [Priapulus caudatus]